MEKEDAKKYIEAVEAAEEMSQRMGSYALSMVLNRLKVELEEIAEG